MKSTAKLPLNARAALTPLLATLLLTLGACASIEPPKSLVNDEFIGTPGKTVVGMDPYKGFKDAYTKALANPQQKAENVVFLNEGMALVQSNCSGYFTRLGSGAQHLGFARKETSLTGGLAAAVMGLAEASATAISATASAFGFTTATMDNFADAYLFAPDIRATQELVMSALEAQRTIGALVVDDVVRNGKSLTYTQVSQFLLEMESYCQPHGIRSLVTKAVNNQRVVPADSQEGAAQATTSMQLLSRQTDETFRLPSAPVEVAPAGDTAKTGPLNPPQMPAAPGANTGLPSPSALRSQSLMLQSK